ncbi:hypothetical protein [Sphingomonas elodea]|uniref:hypothetical protein n=1 Tax=Sphingomonas elodea TaxID=179878 RepID=UPI00307AB259
MALGRNLSRCPQQSDALAICSFFVLADASLLMQRFDVIGSFGMEHDLQLRAAARAIYDACYPSDEWAPFGFDEAERFRTIHYRQAVGAALQARRALHDRAVQPNLFAEQVHA